MKEDELFLLGKIVRTFGANGELVIQINSEILARLKNMESVFIKLNVNLVPFFIENLQPRPKNQAIVKFMDVNSADEATLLAGCEFYIPLEMLPKVKGKKPFTFEIEGYKVIDAHHGEIGTLTAVIEVPQQSLLSVDFNGKEILVPVVEEIVKEIDRKNKTIYIEAPEGLIDLYIN